MFNKVYLALGGILIGAYAAVAFTGQEFGAKKLNRTPPPSFRQTGNRRSGGGWFFGGGGFGGGK